MRAFVIVVSLSLGLAACQQSKSEATTPAPKRYFSRSAQLYAGQEQILRVDSATIEPGKTPDTIILKAVGRTATGGYYDLAFLPRINPGRPADGIYDVDVIGYRPQTAVAQVVTPVEVSGEWPSYPKAHLKGVRFVTQTNDVVASLPKG
jgi:hypothetical protein